MTWEIVIGIFALVSFVAVVIGWTEKISGTMSKLNTSVELLNKTVDKFQNTSDAIHNQLFDKVNNHDLAITSLDERVKNLEKGNSK